jgi:hypothetical protein
LSEQVCRGTIPPQHEYRPCTNPVHATVHCGFRTLTGDECRAAPPAAHPPEGSQPHAHYPDPTDCDTCNDPPTVDKGEAEPPSPPPGPGQNVEAQARLREAFKDYPALWNEFIQLPAIAEIVLRAMQPPPSADVKAQARALTEQIAPLFNQKCPHGVGRQRNQCPGCVHEWFLSALQAAEAESQIARLVAAGQELSDRLTATHSALVEAERRAQEAEERGWRKGYDEAQEQNRVEQNSLEAQVRSAREALAELIAAEWMVTPTWAGSQKRDALLDRLRALSSSTVSGQREKGE